MGIQIRAAVLFLYIAHHLPSSFLSINTKKEGDVRHLFDKNLFYFFRNDFQIRLVNASKQGIKDMISRPKDRSYSVFGV